MQIKKNDLISNYESNLMTNEIYHKNYEATLFFCWSYHHILMAAVKTIVEKRSADIVLINVNNTLTEDIRNQLNMSQIFRKVIYINRDELPQYRRANFIKYIPWRYGNLAKYYDGKINTDLRDYEAIFSFYDFDELTVFLQIKRIKFNLIEDAIGFYRKDKLDSKTFKPFKRWIYPRGVDRILQKIHYCYPIYGQEVLCESIEVDNFDNLNRTKYNKDKFVLRPEKKYFERLSDVQKKGIIKIFAPRLELRVSGNAGLLLTEPLYIDGKLKDEREQLSLYQFIVDKYLRDLIVVVKPHPRDRCNYGLLKCKKIVLDRKFPSEVISLIPGLEFKKYVTLESSAINMFPIEQSISLGALYNKQLE